VDPTQTYVSRGGLKLAAALDAFGLDVGGLICCDLGCSTGGFTDCLLQRGAARVHSVDTAYGQLAWKLRQDERVVVHERSNALHLEPAELVDLAVIDLGWTKQNHALPAALRWLKQSSDASIITLIKPHYERPHEQRDAETAKPPKGPRRRGKPKTKPPQLDDLESQQIAANTLLSACKSFDLTSHGLVASPIRGEKGGNLEWLACVKSAHN